MKYYHHIARAEDGKVYEYKCERFPDGRYNLKTMERHEITDKKYLEWFNKNERVVVL